MRKIIYFLVASFLMIVASCKTNSALQSFTIGKGGGFTGKYDEYLVKSNGEIYNISNGQAPELFITFPDKKIKALFDRFQQLNIKTIQFSYPGNITSYIRLEQDGKLWEIKWGDSRKLPPQNIHDFFESTWSDIRPK